MRDMLWRNYGDAGDGVPARRRGELSFARRAPPWRGRPPPNHRLCGGSDPRRRRHRARRVGLQGKIVFYWSQMRAVRHVRGAVRPRSTRCRKFGRSGTTPGVVPGPRGREPLPNLRRARLRRLMKLFSDARRGASARQRPADARWSPTRCAIPSRARSGDPIASGARPTACGSPLSVRACEHSRRRRRAADVEVRLNRKRLLVAAAVLSKVEDAAGALALQLRHRRGGLGAAADWRRRRSRCCPARPPPRRRDSRGRRPLPTRSPCTRRAWRIWRWGGASPCRRTSISRPSPAASALLRSVALREDRASLTVLERDRRSGSASTCGTASINGNWGPDARIDRDHSAHCPRRRGRRRDAAPRQHDAAGRAPQDGRASPATSSATRLRAAPLRCATAPHLARAAPRRARFCSADKPRPWLRFAA